VDLKIKTSVPSQGLIYNRLELILNAFRERISDEIVKKQKEKNFMK